MFYQCLYQTGNPNFWKPGVLFLKAKYDEALKSITTDMTKKEKDFLKFGIVSIRELKQFVLMDLTMDRPD